MPKENQYLPDEDPNKFIAKMGAEAVHMLLSRIDLDSSCLTTFVTLLQMKHHNNVNRKP